MASSTRIRNQNLDTLINSKSLFSAYNTSVAGRLLREGIVNFIRLEGYDKLKTVLTAVLAALPTLVPTKMDSAGLLSHQIPKVGVPVVAVHSHWDGIPAPTYTYQWKKDGTNISGGTASSYTPVSGDATHTLSCVITATNTGGTATETLTAAGVTLA